jgi:hypothetical protein
MTGAAADYAYLTRTLYWAALAHSLHGLALGKALRAP